MDTMLLSLIVVSSVFVVSMSVMTYLFITRKPETKTETKVVKVQERKTVGMDELDELRKPKPKLILDVVKGYNMEPERVFKNTTYIGAEPSFEEDDGEVIENDIVIPHRTLSSSQAQIVKSGSGFKILNRSLKNPVRVNGRVVDDVKLNDGDIISLGAVEIKVIAQEVTQLAAKAA